MIEQSVDKYGAENKARKRYPYSGLIVCGGCGNKYSRRVRSGKAEWQCRTYLADGRGHCAAKAVPETVLDTLTAGVCLDEVRSITAHAGNRITIDFADGRQIVRTWKDRSRSESWTPEMRAEASRKAKERK